MATEAGQRDAAPLLGRWRRGRAPRDAGTAAGSWKRPGNRFSPGASRGHQLCPHLDVSLGDPCWISGLQNHKIRKAAGLRLYSSRRNFQELDSSRNWTCPR